MPKRRKRPTEANRAEWPGESIRKMITAAALSSLEGQLRTRGVDMDTETTDLAIVKQLASKMTGFGFANSPREAKITHVNWLTEGVRVYTVAGLVPVVPGPPLPAPPEVFALVVVKRHSPTWAYHVVDFRVGGDIYSNRPSEESEKSAGPKSDRP